MLSTPAHFFLQVIGGLIVVIALIFVVITAFIKNPDQSLAIWSLIALLAGIALLIGNIYTYMTLAIVLGAFLLVCLIRTIKIAIGK